MLNMFYNSAKFYIFIFSLSATIKNTKSRLFLLITILFGKKKKKPFKSFNMPFYFSTLNGPDFFERPSNGSRYVKSLGTCKVWKYFWYPNVRIFQTIPKLYLTFFYDVIKYWSFKKNLFWTGPVFLNGI